MQCLDLGADDYLPKTFSSRELLARLRAVTRRARGKGETLDQAKASVALALKPKYDAGMDGRFAGSVGANVEKVYADMDAKRY